MARGTPGADRCDEPQIVPGSHGSVSFWRRLLTHPGIQLQYPSLPWVRYITQSGDIAVRLPDVQ